MKTYSADIPYSQARANIDRAGRHVREWADSFHYKVNGLDVIVKKVVEGIAVYFRAHSLPELRMAQERTIRRDLGTEITIQDHGR
ncbi:hypothetical protein KKA39_01450 [Patescibacteria group bacterium]|nr:hypothetical protein [Patescibacteria group bacterium]